MTLTRLVFAWLPVAAWFLIVILLERPSLSALAQQSALPLPRATSLATWRLVEAAVLTLFASLWFDSLGSGGWWLLFLLVGALVAGAGWRDAFTRAELRTSAAVAGACADVVRYMVAGAILAWRLG